MNIFIYTNDFIQSLIILLIILYGTKLINYYYNFYHIYNYLDYEQKLGYFKSNYLINLISKYNVVKKIIVHYFLIPIIKLNYLFISIFITLLYSLCYFELKKILREQYIKKNKHKRNKKKTYDMILTESSNDIANINKQTKSFGLNFLNNSNNNSNNNYSSNLLKEETNSLKEEINISKEETDFKNNILNIDKIDLDNDKTFNIDKIDLDNDKTFNIIEFMSVEEDLKKSFKLDNIIYDSYSKCHDENENKLKENKKQDISLDSINNKFNLLNEIDLLKTNNINSDINPDINEDNIQNYICDNINVNNNKENTNYSNDNNINEYLFVDNKIENISKILENTNLNEKNIDLDEKNEKNNDKSFMLINDEHNDLINLDDIDFGYNSENITNIKTNNSETIQVIEKKIIKIGKKKKN